MPQQSITAPVVYKDVVGFPGYRVGDDGSVWSCRTSRGNFRSTWKQLKPIVRLRGHLILCLRRDGKTCRCWVHRLVLEAFVGPRPDGTECCHGDGDPGNNRPENLRWDTKSENRIDSVRHGSHAKTKLSQEQVRAIKRRLAEGENPRLIAIDFVVTRRMISHIKNGRAWEWLE